MPDERGSVEFNTPNYNPDPAVDQLEHAARNWRHRHSSTESSVSGARTHPSLVSRGMRHRSSAGSQYRPPSISETLSEEPIGLAGIDLVSARDGRYGSGASSQIRIARGKIDTQHVLQNFAPVAAEFMQKEEEREARMIKHKPLPPRLKSVLDRLRSEQKQSWLGSPLPWPSAQPAAPEFDDLKRLAKTHFPCRSDVKVFITDFKEYSAHLQECRLSEITKYMTTKPADVQVRWIHAPLGVGPLHSTIEDLFLHQGEAGRPFENLGRYGWPYAKIEVLSFIDRKRFQDMRDVYRFLCANTKLTEELNEECWIGFEPSWKTNGKGVLDDLRWRTTHLGLANDWDSLPDYWTVSNSDIPWQIAEGLHAPDYGPLDGLYPTLWQSDKQALHKHRFFGSAQMVRDLFRCFHRVDGFLLTQSPMRGVNFLDKNFKRHLEEPGDAIFDNDVASAIAFVRKQFEDSGTQKWHRANVEWLLIHLLTEIGMTPHGDRQGYNAPTLEGAYQAILQQFRRRRDEHFNSRNRDEPAELIKDMITCKDELRRMTVMSKRRERVFENLGKDISNLEAEDIKNSIAPEHEREISAAEKTQFALRRTQRETEAYESLFEDICKSLTEVYDLRSIQQRQSGIITDGQNHALVLITLVQLVFVPFATLCSYWGMNVSDIRATGMNQHGFWRICASAVLAIGVCSAIAVVLRLVSQARHSLGKEETREREGVLTGPVNLRLDGGVVV
ncbi:MAG: hypothetical protein LQ346_008250 [Caloplaca aetnensis]|nr:MAG: hypothetical protein LQ346_008250 [Caloplaca aetnensis]